MLLSDQLEELTELEETAIRQLLKAGSLTYRLNDTETHTTVNLVPIIDKLLRNGAILAQGATFLLREVHNLQAEGSA